jgi:hypothetical protein
MIGNLFGTVIAYAQVYDSSCCCGGTMIIGIAALIGTVSIFYLLKRR